MKNCRARWRNGSGESFKLVSDRLEQVHQGLGAMQQLASDVGGLQKVLANVKTRGGWGEVQLGKLLEQVLTADQFARNVKTREDSGEHVEFAIKLPGDENGAPVWLPIDAKFPTEDYQRLLAAQDKGDAGDRGRDEKPGDAVEESAKDICEKYINPPRTTDFALMFLPTEGLYAEAIRRVGLVRTGAARLPGHLRRADDAGGVAQQFADGISHAGDSKAFERSLESARRREDRIRKIWRSVVGRERETRSGGAEDGRRRCSFARDHEETARRGGIADQSAAVVARAVTGADDERDRRLRHAVIPSRGVRRGTSAIAQALARNSRRALRIKREHISRDANCGRESLPSPQLGMTIAHLQHLVPLASCP